MLQELKEEPLAEPEAEGAEAPRKEARATVSLIEPDLGFLSQLEAFGARSFRNCYQCATCSATCSLSPAENPFPRKEMLWLKWGLKDRLVRDLDVWTCYYCGECSANCPRDANPGETMMALRRYLTSWYDWTGISRLLYTSRLREITAVVVMGLVVVALFWLSGAFTSARMLTDHVSVSTFIPAEWVHRADWIMAAVLSFFLLTNTARMWRSVMAGEKAPLWAYAASLKTLFVQATTQKKWRECRERDTRAHWRKHVLLVAAYVAMFVLVMFFLKRLQVDTSEFSALSWLGYSAALALLYVSGDAMVGRLRKKDEMHRHSHDSDWMFLILLFATALTGLMMNVFRLMDWAVVTYVTYVVHLAVAVPLLVLEVPFMKWAHLVYRPLALYLREVKARSRAGAVQVPRLARGAAAGTP
jgi:ferredoxin